MSFLITWIPTILVFILMLGLLVFVHEAGHFFAARISGMKVEEFAFGFPPRLWSKKYKGTRYAINLFPIGGYVKILGENEKSKDPDAFGNKRILSRIFVVVSGVLMNFVLAFLVLLVLFWCSYPPLVSNPSVYKGTTIEGSGGIYIQDIAKDSLAEKYDIRSGDVIIKVGEIGNPRVGDLRLAVSANQNGIVPIKIKRNGDIIEKNIEIGESNQIGVGLWEKIGKVKYTWWKVPYYAAKETVITLKTTLVAFYSFFRDLIVDHRVNGDVVGPVGLFNITSVAVKLGFGYILTLIILLTINLGIINILPFPALDGGRLVFLAVEKMRGKKMAENVEGIIHTVGFWLLIALMIYIAVRDIMRM